MYVPAILLFTFLPLFTQADYNATKYFNASGFPRPYGEQFQSWLPKYGEALAETSAGKCSETWHDYREAYAAPRDSPKAKQLLSVCYQHESCLLDSLDPTITANFQSAGVVLGLLPTLVMTIGPSVAESALLSAHRPFLSFLISMGAPGVYVTRVFEYEDPGSIVARDRRSLLRLARSMKQNTPLAVLISAAQYALVLVAAGNVLYTSLDLGKKTILAWGCTTNFLPVLWTSLASVVHVLAAISYALPEKILRPDLQTQRPKEKTSQPEVQTQGLLPSPNGPLEDDVSLRSHSSKASRDQWPLARVIRAVRKETMPCAKGNRKFKASGTRTEATKVAVLLNAVATSCGYIHTIFGTIVMSSLQLVSVYDVLNVVLWRYLVSTLVCRLILLVELDGLQEILDSQKQDKKDQNEQGS